MKSHTLLLSLLLNLGLISTAWAQATPIEETQNNRMKSSINAKYKGVDYDNIKWKSTADGYYQGTFDYEGRDLTTQFDNNGQWVQTSETVTMDNMPPALKNNLSDYKTSSIKSVNKIETADNSTYYDVDVTGREPMRFDKSGNPIKND
ncbi:PepSY-like domain-containing protein [Fulvivirga sediminis]|uniref:PepSY-like domain-containing protein n=1 Tax=Fulvivirga sediminis TaxID=2803949 RepID=A0A937FB32_9BACT|nr:PepSY-like domain-containing protein [Fulvivirga sediminis]MBL3658342.1 PepSY-like domain-containing protein [Fulvivirga sediminis]